MPWAPPRPCPTAGCSRLLAPGQRCPEHGAQPYATSTYRTRRAIPEPLRRRILNRDQHACQWTDDTGICGAPATVVDHIVARALGGTDSARNLQSLCARHARAKTAAEANTIRWHRA